MWSRSYRATVTGLTVGRLWQVWTDVNQWHTWQHDIEYATLDGEFDAGNIIHFKPKGGPRLALELADVVPMSAFVDVTTFPFARMYDSHELIERDGAVEIRTTISVQGPLSFVWRKLVAENVVNGLREQTERLIARARHA